MDSRQITEGKYLYYKSNKQITYGNVDAISDIEIWVDCNNYLHKQNGPAIVSLAGICYYNHGTLHRLDGPAVITNEGSRWIINGVVLSKEKVKILEFWHERNNSK